MSVERCGCGCASRGKHDHHIVTQQEIRKLTRTLPARDRARWLKDRRNLMRMAFDCHLAHHNASARLPLSRLPDCAFAFAVELYAVRFGTLAGVASGRAYEYLRRSYKGEDVRLDALLSAVPGSSEAR